MAEGVNTATEVNKRSEALKVDMPITREVFNVIHNSKSAKDAVLDLLGRSLKQEH